MSVAKPTSFLRHATEVALFYGFKPARQIERAAANRLAKRKGAHSFDAVATLSSVCVALRPTDPVLAFYAAPSPMHLPQRLAARETGEFGLQVVGSQESVGEVVLLKTISAILSEWGATIARVRINALGDRDSQQRFAREVSLYLRKHEQKFEETCRHHTSLFAAYSCGHDTCRAVLSEGPRSMTFLSERSRAHFRSVLEHLENLGLPYELDDLLIGDGRDPHVVFAVDLAEDDATIITAGGGRYDDFFKRLSGRKESSGVAASLYFRKKGSLKANFAEPKKMRAPKIYFVQLGLRAKLQGLTVVDMLRAARIPVSQSFDATHLSPQLIAARELGVSHALIMGQREAIDGTIIVRSMQNSSQIIVQVQNLPRFLKTLQK
jgi:histidyl-tRNA synthetase